MVGYLTNDSDLSQVLQDSYFHFVSNLAFSCHWLTGLKWELFTNHPEHCHFPWNEHLCLTVCPTIGVEKLAQPARHVAWVVKNLELGEDNMEMYCTIIIETWAGARTMRKVEWVRNICDDITRIFMIWGFLTLTSLMHIIFSFFSLLSYVSHQPGSRTLFSSIMTRTTPASTLKNCRYIKWIFLLVRHLRFYSRLPNIAMWLWPNTSISAGPW